MRIIRSLSFWYRCYYKYSDIIKDLCSMVNPLITDPCSLRCPHSLENLSRGLQPWRTQDDTLGRVRKIWPVWFIPLITNPWSPLSKHRRFVVYSMNKTERRRKIFITRVNVASWFSTFQPLLNHLLWGEIALWLGVLGIRLQGKISSCYTLGLYLRILWRVSGSVWPQKHPQLPWAAGAPPPKQADQKNRFCGPVSWDISWSSRVHISWSAGADISWSGNRNYSYFSEIFFYWPNYLFIRCLLNSIFLFTS